METTNTNLDDVRVDLFKAFLSGRKKYYFTLEKLGKNYLMTLPLAWQTFNYPYDVYAYTFFPFLAPYVYGYSYYRAYYSALKIEHYIRLMEIFMEIMFGEEEEKSRLSI